MSLRDSPTALYSLTTHETMLRARLSSAMVENATSLKKKKKRSQNNNVEGNQNKNEHI